MNSTRILLSDRHFHDLRLSEMEIGVILHALTVLRAAFSEEKQYLRLVDDEIDRLQRQLEVKGITVGE